MVKILDSYKKGEMPTRPWKNSPAVEMVRELLAPAGLPYLLVDYEHGYGQDQEADPPLWVIVFLNGVIEPVRVQCLRQLEEMGYHGLYRHGELVLDARDLSPGMFGVEPEDPVRDLMAEIDEALGMVTPVQYHELVDKDQRQVCGIALCTILAGGDVDDLADKIAEWWNQDTEPDTRPETPELQNPQGCVGGDTDDSVSPSPTPHPVGIND